MTHTSESVFLFDDDITNYINELFIKSCDLRTVAKKLNPNLPPGEERNRLAEEEANLLQWFSDQLKTSQQKFTKYLKFK